jgi:hypothetical protein
MALPFHLLKRCTYKLQSALAGCAATAAAAVSVARQSWYNHFSQLDSVTIRDYGNMENHRKRSMEAVE